jgi:hypothetical protein
MQKKETIYDMALNGAKKSPHRAPKKIDYGREIVMTFSNHKSLFSSKKIERFIVFWTFLVLTVVYIVKNIHEMDSLEFIEVIGLWLAYGGYNSLMNLRDKKVGGSSQPSANQDEEPSTEPC